MLTVEFVNNDLTITLSEINKFLVDNTNRQNLIISRLKEVSNSVVPMVLQLDEFKKNYIGMKNTLDKTVVTEENYKQLYLDLKRIRINLKVHRRLLELD